MERAKTIPLCVRCAERPAVACVRSPRGDKDAVCVACATERDAMLPLYWPGLRAEGER